MELYVLDSLLRRTAVVDSFDSVVWTERFNTLGDCTLNIHSTLANRNLLTQGVLLAMNRSNRIMRIDTVEDKANNDGTHTIVCTCSSAEIWLDDKPAWDSLVNGTTAEPNWVITGLPADIAREIFGNIMVEGLLDANDVLPFYTVGNMYPADTIAEPDTSVTVSLSIGTVLAALVSICGTYDLGFRITRNFDTSQVFFNIYSGNNRTSNQTAFPAVIFAPVLDNLLDSSYLTSMKQYKNVAYVWCPDETAKVFDVGIDDTVAGFQRHVLPVNATNIKYADRTTAGVGGVPAYTVTTAQAAAVTVAQNLTNTTQLQKNSLGNIPNMKRLLAQDLVNINAVLANVFAFTGTQSASITAAKTVTGVTTDQVTALTDLGNQVRLTSAEVSSLNTLVSNNTTLTSAQKTDITAAANLQNSTLLPSEITTLNAAITTSTNYNVTESANLQAELQAYGLQQLANYNNITAFDGEIPQVGSYKYDFDYFLGDLAEVRNADGVVSVVRVTEQIFSQDSSGEKSYPTLASREVITPGVWASWDENQHWADVDPSEHWGDLS